jgi:cell wall-associated NlpC family hydrolase
MRRVSRSVAALIAVGATVFSTGLVSRAAADPLSSARERAAALTKTVSQLQTQAEVAIERYDGTEARLNAAVAARGQADQALETVANRARALYESGGNPTMLASLLTNPDPIQALDGYRMAGAVLAYESHTARLATDTLAKAHSLDERDAAISHQVIELQIAQQAETTRIQSTLNTERQALAAANSTVRSIVRADQIAAAAAAAADFVNAVQAAGGTVNLSGSATPPNAIAAAAIAAARSRLGVPYVWGATGPNSFDCSGLTQWSYAHAGITLPRTAAEQWNAGPHPSLNDLEPGDLLFFATDTSNPATIHHVTMYIGKGMMIAAPETGENVQIQPVYMTGFIGAMRPWATSAAATS